MADLVHSLVVVLEEDLRTDDAEPIINAIKQMRGVISVNGVVSDFNSHMAEKRAIANLGEKLMKIVYP